MGVNNKVFLKDQCSYWVSKKSANEKVLKVLVLILGSLGLISRAVLGILYDLRYAAYFPRPYVSNIRCEYFSVLHWWWKQNSQVFSRCSDDMGMHRKASGIEKALTGWKCMFGLCSNSSLRYTGCLTTSKGSNLKSVKQMVSWIKAIQF